MKQMTIEQAVEVVRAQLAIFKKSEKTEYLKPSGYHSRKKELNYLINKYAEQIVEAQALEIENRRLKDVIAQNQISKL